MAISRVAGLCIIIWLSLAGCGSPREATHEQMELGWMDRAALEQPVYHNFRTTYDTARVDSDIVQLIGVINDEVKILVFLGTWCSDSQREVPRFFKVVDAVGISPSRIKLYGLDRTKKSPDGLTDKYNIDRVPTFVFLKHEREVGRITERPHASLEADMLAILADAQGK